VNDTAGGTMHWLALHAAPTRAELSKMSVETSVVIGTPFVELLRASKEWRADLLVVGVSPPGEAHFLESRAERLVRKSPVAVLVVKQEWTRDPATILVPTDFSVCAQWAADQAIALAQVVGGTVVFPHVVDLSTPYAFGQGSTPLVKFPTVAEDLESEWHDFLQQVSPPKTVQWEKLTRGGRAAQAIVEVAKESAADLVVMGTHGRSEIVGMLIGSVAEKVVRAAACSVMTVRLKAFRLQLP
jgi:nucleotide-binding universal stress UspA family protein